MNEEQVAALRGLMREQRLLSLGVVEAGEPYVGLVPYALAPGLRGLLVHVSRLARHARGLGDEGRFSALIHRPDGPDVDPLQMERVTFVGSPRLPGRDGDEYASGRDLYLQRFPGSRVTFGLGDFELYLLEPDGGRWVSGFAQAVNLTAQGLEQLWVTAD